MWANSDLDFRWFRVFEVNGPGLQMLFWKVHGGRTCPTGEVCSKLFGLRAMLFLVVTFLWIAVVVGKTTGAFLAGSASSTSIYPATIWAWGWFASTFSMLFIARAVHSAQHPSAPYCFCPGIPVWGRELQHCEQAGISQRLKAWYFHKPAVRREDGIGVLESGFTLLKRKWRLRAQAFSISESLQGGSRHFDFEGQLYCWKLSCAPGNDFFSCLQGPSKLEAP